MNGFAYSAEQHDGTPVRGIIEADHLAAAGAQLAAMGLRVLSLTPTGTPVRPVRLGAADFQTFNEYLLQISRAGLPIEGGLAALSRELRAGKLRGAMDALAEDLRAGVPLETAVASRRTGFPPLYGRLIDAGMQAGDLPGVLGRFGRHAQAVADLRAGLWRAASYPAVVFVALLGLLTFLGYGLLPRYFALVSGMTYRTYDRTGYGLGTVVHNIHLPAMAWAMLYLGRAAPFVLAALALVTVGVVILYGILRAEGRERALIDLATRLPIVGRAMRDSYVASWLDVAAIGAAAGLDLPRALRLAGDAVAVPSLSRDTAAIVERLESGRPAGDVVLARLPATVPMAIDTAQGADHLPRVLRQLAEQYEDQAKRQISVVPGRVMPVLLVVVGLLAGGILYSLWIPLAQVLSAMTY